MHHLLVAAFHLLVGVAVPLAAFATGLRATDPLWLLRRPRLLARSLLAILIVVPVVEIALVEIVARSDLAVRAGVVVSILSVGISPVESLRHARADHPGVCYELCLNVVLLSAAVFYIPLAVALHGAVFHHSVSIGALAVARVVLLQALVPLTLGLLLGHVLPRAMARVGRWLEIAVQIALAGAFLLALWLSGRALLHLGLMGWMTCAVVAILGILIGHALGGPSREERTVLATACSLRFPGLALLLVSVIPGGSKLIPEVAAYVVTSVALLTAYELAGRRGHGSPSSAIASGSTSRREQK